MYRAPVRWLPCLGLLLLACDDDPDARAQVVDVGVVDGSVPDGAVPADGSPPVDSGADAPLRADGPLDGGAPPPEDAASLPPDAGGAWRFPERSTCPSGYQGALPLGAMTDPAVVEASGIVPSALNEDVVWVHNDSGDGPLLYAMRTNGAALGRVRVDDPAEDWEDIAVAACPDGSGPCLWVADTGNNAGARESLMVIALPEPVVDGQFGEREVEPGWRFPVRFADEPLDFEALAVAPDGSTFWLFEKVDLATARVFRHPGPLVRGRPATLVQVARIDTPGVPIAMGRMITGADLHQSGARLLLRVYAGSYEYRFEPGQGPDDLAEVRPTLVSVGPLSEPQGEAIAYDHAGTGILTVSEGEVDEVTMEPQSGQDIHHYACREPGE